MNKNFSNDYNSITEKDLYSFLNKNSEIPRSWIDNGYPIKKCLAIENLPLAVQWIKKTPHFFSYYYRERSYSKSKNAYPPVFLEEFEKNPHLFYQLGKIEPQFIPHMVDIFITEWVLPPVEDICRLIYLFPEKFSFKDLGKLFSISLFIKNPSYVEKFIQSIGPNISLNFPINNLLFNPFHNSSYSVNAYQCLNQLSVKSIENIQHITINSFLEKGLLLPVYALQEQMNFINRLEAIETNKTVNWREASLELNRFHNKRRYGFSSAKTTHSLIFLENDWKNIFDTLFNYSVSVQKIYAPTKDNVFHFILISELPESVLCYIAEKALEKNPKLYFFQNKEGQSFENYCFKYPDDIKKQNIYRHILSYIEKHKLDKIIQTQTNQKNKIEKNNLFLPEKANDSLQTEQIQRKRKI